VTFSKVVVWLAMLGAWTACQTTVSVPVAAPRPTSFVVHNRAVRVVTEKPDAIQRGTFGDCEYYAPWRPELIAPVVSYVTTRILQPAQRLLYVFAFDKDASISAGVKAELKPQEFAIAIDSKVLILYNHTRARYFCLTVVEKDDILVRLDLFNVMEDEHPL
jgi:hypothetical protein